MSERDNIFCHKGIDKDIKGKKAASFRSRRPLEQTPVDMVAPLDAGPAGYVRAPIAKPRQSASFDAFAKYVEAARTPGGKA